MNETKPKKWNLKRFLKSLYDFFVIFISFTITDCITYRFKISFWLYELLMYLACYLFFTLIGKIIRKLIEKYKKQISL